MSSNKISYKFIFDNDSELDKGEKEQQNILLNLLDIKEYKISFLPPKIISYKLFCKYFLFFKRIIILRSDIKNDPFSQNEELDNYLKIFFNIKDFEYNLTNIKILITKLKIDLQKEHNIEENIKNENTELDISHKMILEYWYYVILEQILFQILIPSMNNIEDLMTFNYYMYENQDKLRKMKFIRFILKDYYDLQKTKSENEYKLITEITSQELLFLYRKIEDKKTNNKADNNIQDKSIETPLIYFYKCIIEGKQKWYQNLEQNSENCELLIEFENLNKEDNILLSLICFTFLANRIVTSPLNPKRDKIKSFYEFDISHAYLKGIRLQQAITQIQFEKQIQSLILKDNTFEYLGMYELAIVCFLNKNIYHIDLTKCALDQSKLQGFLKGLQHIQPFQDEKHFLNITKLNLTNNKCSGKTLAQIIQLIPQIRLLILNQNIDAQENEKGELKKDESFAHLFNVLEKLYRKNKSNLKYLFLVKCSLHENSLYELQKLIKSWHCKLKLLALNETDLSNEKGNGISFLKNLKYNRSLEELYLNRTNLNENHNSLLLNIIPKTFIKKLYLHKNNLSVECSIQIIAQTQLENEIEENNKINTLINNIDLSEQISKEKDEKDEASIDKLGYNSKHVIIILKILKKSGLQLLDISGNFSKITTHSEIELFKQELPKILKNGLVTFC